MTKDLKKDAAATKRPDKINRGGEVTKTNFSDVTKQLFGNIEIPTGLF